MDGDRGPAGGVGGPAALSLRRLRKTLELDDATYKSTDYPDLVTMETSLVAYWRLGEKTRTTAKDSFPTKFYSIITSREDGRVKRGYMLYVGPPLPGSRPPGHPMKVYWQFGIGTGDPAKWEQLVGSEVEIGKTVHLVASCDGKTQMKLWVDGGKEEAGLFQTELDGQSYPASDPQFANRPRAPRCPFIGRIQDVAVYKPPP